MQTLERPRKALPFLQSAQMLGFHKTEDKRHIWWFLDRLLVNNNPTILKSYSLFQVKRSLSFHSCPLLRSTLTHPCLLGAPVSQETSELPHYTREAGLDGAGLILQPPNVVPSFSLIFCV